MLKLERSPKNSQVAILIRQRDAFWNQTLSKALCLAVAFHLGGYMLFSIIPFPLGPSFLFPPVELLLEPGSLTSSLPISDLENSLIRPPPFLRPGLPFPSLSSETELHVQDTAYLDPVLQNIDGLLPPFSEVIKQPAARIYYSGELASFKLVQLDPLFQEMRPVSLPITEPLYLSYQVRLDSKSGALFWFDQLKSSGVEAVDQYGTRLLTTLRFEPSQKSCLGIFVDGRVDLVFNDQNFSYD